MVVSSTLAMTVNVMTRAPFGGDTHPDLAEAPAQVCAEGRILLEVMK